MKRLSSMFIFLMSSTILFAQVPAQRPAPAPLNPVGMFENHVDIGNPKMKGSASYDPATQTYTVTGGGSNIWFNHDELHFLYKRMNGDFILTANFQLIGNENGNGHRKTGWIIRETTDDASASINSCLHGDGLAVLQWRALRGTYMRDPADEIFFPKRYYSIIQLERIGKKITMKVAHPGEPLQIVSSIELPDFKDQVLVGLYSLAHDEVGLQEAKIWNVRIDRPVPTDYHPNPAVKLPPTQNSLLGCRLEVMNVFDGKRKAIYESSTTKFESPNWMPDGKRLLFNQEGSLFTIPAEGGTPEKFNTGSINSINSEHGISPDGRKLAISSNVEGKGSAVYVLPIQGGEPKLLTSETPSYWHGWSPNSKEVFYVGQRNNEKIYNIYKANVDGAMKEVQLTFNKAKPDLTKGGHIDGPELSPDGKYVYYNANESGTMQIWRMKPDGTAKEQLTFDENHNWFPHISPDGKWIVYISFPEDIEINSHPSFKNLTIKLMPTAGGAPRIIAYLQGGQGTMNVPSWSPDSKNIAFVSNSEKVPDAVK